jgi:copper(I)-binding protein
MVTKLNWPANSPTRNVYRSLRLHNWLWLALILTGSYFLSACEAQVPQPTPGQLTVVQLAARPAPLAGGNGAVYMTILNGTESEQRLLSASSPAAQAAELHETVNENGVMRMVYHPEGFVVPAGGSVRLAPGGKHLMLINLAASLAAGDAISVTLQFQPAGPMTLSVPVTAQGQDEPSTHDTHSP